MVRSRKGKEEMDRRKGIEEGGKRVIHTTPRKYIY